MRLRPARTVALVALCLGLGVPAARAADPPPLPAASQIQADRDVFLGLASQGLTRTQKLWWNENEGWYSSQLGNPLPLASAWTIFPFFELTAMVAVAAPTDDNRDAVTTLATKAERYWDRTLASGAGGYGWYWGAFNSGNAFFDDNGWLGIAYLDAYRATKKTRWLWDAARALGFIDRYGWDWKGGGGVWWDLGHDHKTSEPLAAGALIAATLYRYQHKQHFLDVAKRYIAWADAKTAQVERSGLYGRSATDGTIMDYVEGMMIEAHAELCVATKDQRYCDKAADLANASLKEFPVLADWAPETDVVFLHGLLRLYEVDHNPRWYAALYANAKRAAKNARDGDGLWTLRWDGAPAPPVGALYTQAATLELFGLVSVATPPGAAQ